MHTSRIGIQGRHSMEDKKLYILAGYDDATEEQLAGLQKKLYEAGFVGKETKNIPMHITLGSFPTDREEELKADLQRIAAKTADGISDLYELLDLLKG